MTILVNTDLDIKDLTAKIKSCGNLNFSLCLYGEPGTGKSLYARYLAKEQVNTAFEHFFGIKNVDVNIKGLTAGDFATVKKKAGFLCITDLSELSKMLEDEVKIKKSKELQNSVGF